MALRGSVVDTDVEGEKNTNYCSRLDNFPNIVTLLIRINYLLLAPWIIFSLPPLVLGQQSILIVAGVTLVGTAGMLVRNRTAISTASAALLLVIIWSKIADDLYRLPGPDSAVLLLQFILVIFLMEASTTVLTFDSSIKELRGKTDELSSVARMRVTKWERVQLLSLGKLTLASFGLSLGLLILGGLISVSVNQIAFSGVLALAAVVAIFVLITFRREPEEGGRSAQ